MLLFVSSLARFGVVLLLLGNLCAVVHRHIQITFLDVEGMLKHTSHSFRREWSFSVVADFSIVFDVINFECVFACVIACVVVCLQTGTFSWFCPSDSSF